MPLRATFVSGFLLSLAFRMTHSSDGRAVTAPDPRGEVVTPCFGFTRRPDICPPTPDASDPVSKISHGSAVYVFSPSGRSRNLLSYLADTSVDLAAMEEGFDRPVRTARP